MSDFFAFVYQLFTQNWTLILFIVFAFAIAIQLFYYFFIYLRVFLYRNKPLNQSNMPVSVVICARDEEQNLKVHLPQLVNQKYTEYEVFIILDACVDDSLDLLKNKVNEFSNLRYTVITKDVKFTHGKKLALTVGLKGAKYDHLLLTDADCLPASELWLQRMVSHFNQGYEIVLGYGKFQPDGTFLNKLVRYDSFFIGQQYLGMALFGLPYMGVGRNLAYKREIYTRIGGFSKHAHIESGDDDLLVNAAANKRNCTIEIHPEAHTISYTPKTFRRWKLQKSRHLKASHLYKGKHKFALSVEPLSRIIAWFAPIPLFFHPEWFYVVLALSLSRFSVFMTITVLSMRKLNEKALWYVAPLFDISLPFVTFWFLLNNRFRKRTTSWK